MPRSPRPESKRPAAGCSPQDKRVTALEGQPPKQRVAVQVWDSMEKIQAWRNSAEFKEARKIGDKYAKFRAFTVEGLPQ